MKSTHLAKHSVGANAGPNSKRRMRIEFSDQDVRERVGKFLRSRHFPAFQNLEVSVSNGAVTLVGEVCSFYEKQVALTSCQRVAGVLSLIDEIAVEGIVERADS